MDEDRISYSDLIQPDASLDEVIEKLAEISKYYGEMVAGIRAGASKITQSMRAASGATEEGRDAIRSAAEAAVQLEKAQYGASLSYGALQKELKAAVSLFKEVVNSEKSNEEAQKELAQNILVLRERLKELDAQMPIHIQALDKVGKAERELAFLQSEEGKQYTILRQKISDLTQEYKQEASVANILVKQQMELARAEQELAIKSTDEYQANERKKASLQGEIRLKELAARVTTTTEGSYANLAAQYEYNKARLNSMNAAEREEAELKERLITETKALRDQMVQLQESTGTYNLSVGKYTKVWDGLGFSITQVVRELPSAAINLNTFFLAISNNIPIVIDEIRKLKAENAAAIKNGGQAKSVIGSITKALFSWQTALTVGLTVLATHGEEIVNWIANLVKGEKQSFSTKEAIAAVNAELENTNDSYGANIVSLKKLQSEWKNLKTAAEKNQWIKDNKSEFDKLEVAVTSVNDADRVFVKQTAAVIKSLQLRAKAAAAEKLAQEEYESLLKQQVDIETNYSDLAIFSSDGKLKWLRGHKGKEAEAYATLEGARASAAGAPGYASLYLAETAPGVEDARKLISRSNALRAAQKKYNKTSERANIFTNMAIEYYKEADKIIEDLDLTPHKKDKTKTPKTPKTPKTTEPKDLSEKIAKRGIDLQKKYEQSLTRLERDELEKRAQERKIAREDELRKLGLQYEENVALLKANSEATGETFELDGKKYKKLTDDQISALKSQQEQIKKITENTLSFYTQEDLDLELDKQKRALQTQAETNNLRLEAVKKGSKEETELRLLALELEAEQALVANQKLTEDQQQDANAIIAKYTKKAALIKGEAELEAFENAQKLQEEEFNGLVTSERKKEVFLLEHERDLWAKKVELAEAGMLDWSQSQIDIAKKHVDNLNQEISDKTGFKGFVSDIAEYGVGGSILASLGFDDEGIAAAEDATDKILGFLGDILSAETELAEAELARAKERVDKAKEAVDAEIEARNNGYANNVTSARKEYELEKKKAAEKQKLLEQAQKRQAALDTAMQTTSLITASANIWKSMSGVSIIGPALATAAIAGMWASFAVSKIKARQVAAAQQEYGEGGLEFLEGGSHASGHDIDLATKNSRGRNMRAEGGEAMAIINKHSARRYRKQLPGIVDALNKGTFEDKYLRAFEVGENVLLNFNSADRNVDLSKLEKYTEKISKQGEVQRVSLPNGAMLLINKNVSRIIKR